MIATMAEGGGGRMLPPMRKLLPIAAVALTALTLTTLSSASATPSHPPYQPSKQVFTLTTKTLVMAGIWTKSSIKISRPY